MTKKPGEYSNIISLKTIKTFLNQGVQSLQAFAFCVVTINDEHMKPRFKWKHRD